MIPCLASLNIGLLCLEYCWFCGVISMTLHLYTLAYAACVCDVYDVVKVMRIHNLVCGDAVDPPHLYAPYCGCVVAMWWRLDRLARAYALRRCSHKGEIPKSSNAFCCRSRERFLNGFYNVVDNNNFNGYYEQMGLSNKHPCVRDRRLIFFLSFLTTALQDYQRCFFIFLLDDGYQTRKTTANSSEGQCTGCEQLSPVTRKPVFVGMGLVNIQTILLSYRY